MTNDQMHPDHAIIIPHYNDPTRLTRCLEALEDQSRGGVEIVVVDNGSDVDLSPLQRRFVWARFVVQDAPGAGAARNRGVEQTTAPWLFFLDSDCVPAADWIAQARTCAGGDTRVVTGGQVRVFDETPAPRSGAEAFETVFAFDQENYITHKGFSVTANLVIARDVFEDVGPFLIGVSEDLEWCHRARKKGYPLRYDAGLSVAHPTRSDWTALRRKWLRLTQESFGLRPTGLKAQLVWACRALAMPVSAVAHTWYVLRHSDLTLRDRLVATATLFRLRGLRMVWMLKQSMGRDIG